MRYAPILFAVAAVMLLCGCSGVSTVERASFTSFESRQQYIAAHPTGAHNDCIRNGEIVPGMDANEVTASWGLPNVYVVTRTRPAERWIYYVRDRDSLSMLIYTLSFDNDTLRVWNVDQRRFVAQGIISKNETLQPETPVSTSFDPKRK